MRCTIRLKFAPMLSICRRPNGFVDEPLGMVPPPRTVGGSMQANYTAIILQDGEWWIGWVEEVPGVNSQGHTREELLDNLHDALEEALEMNRGEARAAASGA